MENWKRTFSKAWKVILQKFESNSSEDFFDHFVVYFICQFLTINNCLARDCLVVWRVILMRTKFVHYISFAFWLDLHQCQKITLIKAHFYFSFWQNFLEGFTFTSISRMVIKCFIPPIITIKPKKKQSKSHQNFSKANHFRIKQL